jgi:SAM-dependent methyltransferase
MDPLRRFSNRADDYARYRPSYPTEAIDCVLEGLGDPGNLLAADIGAGTGISSRLLASRGVHVSAIEPNAAMREAATPHPSVEFRDGSAESTWLADGSVDLVTCFQSFHWVKPDEAYPEFKRILRPRGRLALIWNDRDFDDPLTAGYSEIIQKASDRHPAEGGVRRAEEVPSPAPFFDEFGLTVFRYHQPLDREGLIGRALSSSYVPLDGPAYETMLSELRELYQRNRNDDGLIELAYLTKVFVSQRRS